MRKLLWAVVLLSFVQSAEASTHNFYFHENATAVTVPGGTTQQYMNQTAPTAGTPHVTSTITVTLATFTSTGVASAADLEALVTSIVNVSANQLMNACVAFGSTVSRLNSSGTATVIGTGSLTGTTVPQGSGGGLSGYAAISIPTIVALARSLASGEAVKVVVTATNNCSSNRSLRLVYDGTPAQSRVEFTSPDVTLYGAEGQFGAHEATLNGGQTLARVYVPEWSISPGQGLWFPTLASDGNLFISNVFQTHNAFFVTSCDMAVSCFNPTAKQCPGEKFYSTIRIPDANENTFVPSLSSPSDCSSHVPGGAEVGDVARIDTEDGERIAMLSGRASIGPIPIQVGPTPFATPTTNFPAFASLEKVSNVWGVDVRKTAPQIRASHATIGPLACPGTSTDCQALNELEQFPGSGRLVATSYFGGVVVMDTSGNLLARYVATPSSPSGCSFSGYATGPREVNVDPKGVESCTESGCTDERFMVAYDTFASVGGISQTFQEFKYDDTTHTITPITTGLFATSAAFASAPCGTQQAGTSQGITGGYDADGNLWIGRQRGQLTAAVDVYLRDPSTGDRPTLSNGCDATHSWGTSCTADEEVSNVFSSHLVDDPGSGAMFAAWFFRGVVAIDKSTFSVVNTIDLNLSRLPAHTLIPPSITTNTLVGHAVLDEARHTLWVVAGSGEQPTTDFLHCNNCYTPGATRNSWLYGVDIDRMLD